MPRKLHDQKPSEDLELLLSSLLKQWSGGKSRGIAPRTTSFTNDSSSTASAFFRAWIKPSTSPAVNWDRWIVNLFNIGKSAGADTTASAVQAFFLAMTMYPDVQKKAQAELDAIVGSDRLPTCSTIHPSSTPIGTSKIRICEALLRLLSDMDEGKICPRRFFSDRNLFAIISSVLSVFDILPPVDDKGNPTKLEYKPTTGFISYPSPFLCCIIPRTSEKKKLILEAQIVN
ncbi:hypothetical protein BJ165DRAFT_1612032 [Panaeolus papilionaceus]|nr:hypothetical protein BJ165DRAFT_1612032 [Panaeolus papilionaceus]